LCYKESLTYGPVDKKLNCKRKNDERMNSMNLKHFAVAGLFALGAAAPAASMAADAEAGKAKAGVCAACHGQNGISQVPIYPNLAGQKEQYLVAALKAYKAGQRQGGQAPVMQGQATALSDEDIANLAAYYASLPAGGK
jgi:cytochrome c553